MDIKLHARVMRPIIFATIFSVVVLLYVLTASYVDASSTKQTTPDGSLVSNPVNLPVIFNAERHGEYGIDMGTIKTGTPINLVAEAGFSWVRKSGLFWADVQPTRDGGYQWSAAAWLDSELLIARQNGLDPILIIQVTPGWAQKISGKSCGPMRETYFDEFGAFLAAAVQRYSQAPYFVTEFEIWNEPDIDPRHVGEDSMFGCWGDEDDPYYGGRYYGEMLKVVYPMMKAANPDINVHIGGLLMDCDPINPPSSGKDCKPSLFLEGILVSGAKDSFDGVGFHAYDYYYPDVDSYGNPNWAKNGTEPVMIAKVAFIQYLLDKYGAEGKFLVNSEVALICIDTTACSGPIDSPFEQMKKAFAAQAYATSATIPNLKANIWYNLYGWRYSGLLSGSTPRPAYYAIDYSEEMLGSAKYLGPVNFISDTTGFKFSTPSINRLWVLWTPDGASRSVTLPQTPIAIWDSLGNTISVTSTSINLSIDPVYIQMP